MSLYEASVPQFKKMLKNLDSWIEKAVAHAKSKAFDPNVYAEARLAPDQYPFKRQVQSACDAAKFACARVSGKEPPKHPDNEQTIDELRARIQSVLTYLDTFTAADFKDADKRMVPISFMPGKGAIAGDFLNELSLPNFYFHLVTAYAILRHNGVDVGKQDYIGSINLRDV